MSEIEWNKVELDYRSGVMSIGMICRVHGLNRTTLMDHVASAGWVRDLMSQVRAEVNERLYMDRKEEAAKDDAVSVAAEMMVQVVLSHRKDIQSLRAVLNKTMARFNELLDTGVFEEVISEDGKKVTYRPTQAAMVLGKTQGVATALDNLASAFQRVIEMEREAFGFGGLGGAASAKEDNTMNRPVATVQVYLPANHRDPNPE